MAARYLRLFFTQFRASLLFALQYRSDFVVDGLVEITWAASSLVPLLVVLRGGRTLGGWGYGESLVVVGWFTVLKALLDGVISPSITTVVEHVRKGTLDFVLIKPADAQFLVSTARFYPWRGINVFTGILIFTYAFHLLGRSPSPADLGRALVSLLDAVTILYALLVLTVSIAFYAVRVDNLTFLLSSVFDAARWPAAAFRGIVRVVLTYVIPLVLMTTYPAEALLGSLSAEKLLGATAGSVAFAILARAVWLKALAAYTPA